jgi:hypothetical protein
MRHKISALLLIAVCTIMTAACEKVALIDARDYGRIRIDSVFPARGPAGSYFEVYGDNFTFEKEDVQAFMGTTPLKVVNASVEKLLLKLPDNITPGEVKLIFKRIHPVHPHSGDAMDSMAITRLFELAPATVPTPGLTAFITPSGGAGNTVLIKGYNFSTLHDSQVWFGGIRSERMELTDTTMRVKIPAGVPEGATTAYVEQNGQRSRMLPFTILKPLPQIKTLYYTSSGQIFVANNQDAFFTAELLYGYDQNVGGAFDLRADHKKNILYWIDYNTSAIMYAPMDGSGPVETFYTYDADFDNAPYKFELSGDKMYVSVFKNSGGVEIREINIDGSGTPKTLYSFPDSYPSYMRIYEKTGKIYWVEDKVIMSANIDGSGDKTKVFEVASNEEIAYFDIDDKDSKLYVRMSGQTTGMIQIRQIDLNGSKPPVPFVTDGRPGYVLVDRALGLLYWLDVTDQAGILYRTDASASFREKVGDNVRAADSFIFDME